jgi:hypothetical protein
LSVLGFELRAPRLLHRNSLLLCEPCLRPEIVQILSISYFLHKDSHGRSPPPAHCLYFFLGLKCAGRFILTRQPRPGPCSLHSEDSGEQRCPVMEPRMLPRLCFRSHTKSLKRLTPHRTATQKLEEYPAPACWGTVTHPVSFAPSQGCKETQSSGPCPRSHRDTRLVFCLGLTHRYKFGGLTQRCLFPQGFCGSEAGYSVTELCSSLRNCSSGTDESCELS